MLVHTKSKHDKNTSKTTSNQAVLATQLILIIKSSVQKNTQHSKQHRVCHWLVIVSFVARNCPQVHHGSRESRLKRCAGQPHYLLRFFFCPVSLAHGSSPWSMSSPSVYVQKRVAAMVFMGRTEPAAIVLISVGSRRQCESRLKRCAGEPHFLVRFFFSLVSRAHGSFIAMVHVLPVCVRTLQSV
jgi:hypothetical protein